MDERYQRVDQDPRFRALARQRARLGWGLASLVMVAYFGFIFGIAWQPDLLARKLWAGTAFTWGLAWGLGVMFLGLGLTGVYVKRANGVFDRLNSEIVESATRDG